MSIPVTIALNSHTRGDKWREIVSIGPILIDGSQPAQTLSRVRMQFVNREDGLRYTIDSNVTNSRDASITITNPATWVADIPEIQKFLPTAGIWDWDMEFYSGTDESPITLYEGEIEALNDV